MFTRSEARDMQANLFTIKVAANTEGTKGLLCFVCDEGRGDKVSSEITDLFGGKTFSTVFFRYPGL